MSNKMKIFIALDLDAQAHSEFTAVIAAYKPKLPPEITQFILPTNYHITLAFLGEIEANILPILSKNLHQMAQSITSFKLIFTDVAYFPNSAHPKVLAAIIHPTPELMALQNAIALVLKKINLPAYKKHDHFSPHISIAYCKTLAHPAPVLPKMPINMTSIINSLVVYQSHTHGTTARYEKIEEIVWSHTREME